MKFAPRKGGNIKRIPTGVRPEEQYAGVSEVDIYIILAIVGGVLSAIGTIIGFLISYNVIQINSRNPKIFGNFV